MFAHPTLGNYWSHALKGSFTTLHNINYFDEPSQSLRYLTMTVFKFDYIAMLRGTHNSLDSYTAHDVDVQPRRSAHDRAVA